MFLYNSEGLGKKSRFSFIEVFKYTMIHTCDIFPIEKIVISNIASTFISGIELLSSGKYLVENS